MLKKKSGSVSYSRYGYYFTLPFMISFCIFILVPIGYSIILSFTDLKSLKPLSSANFVGLKNFITAITSKQFWRYFGNVSIIWVMYTIPQMVLGTLFAVWYANVTFKVPGVGFYKLAMYMPSIVASVAMGLLFSQIFAYPTGVINNLLKALEKEPFNFLLNIWATRSIVAFICFWKSYGGVMIILMACIKGIDPTLFEAAQVDGANNVQTFFHVTLPALRTMILYLTVTSIVGGLQNFEIIRMLSGGGPFLSTYSPVYYIYDMGIVDGRYGQAGATAIVFSMMLMLLSAIAFYLLRDRDTLPRQGRKER